MSRLELPVVPGAQEYAIDALSKLVETLGVSATPAATPATPGKLSDYDFAVKYLKDTPLFPEDGPSRWFEPAPMHHELSSLANSHRRLLLQIAREFAKSTWFTVIRVLRLICENRNIRIIVISKTQVAAGKFISMVRQQLEVNEKLIAAYGLFRPRKGKWTDTEFVVIRAAAYREYTLQAVGRGGQIVSGRYDVVIADDVEDTESTKTDQRRQDTYDWMLRDVVPVVTAQGQVLVIQTPQHEADLVGQIKVKPLWKLINIPAEAEVPTGALEARDAAAQDGLGRPAYPPWLRRRSQWPEKWPVYWNTECGVAQVERRGGSETAQAVAAGAACPECPVFNAALGDTHGRHCLTGKKLADIGIVFYRLQYMCDISALGGEFFQEDWFGRYEAGDIAWNDKQGGWWYKQAYPLRIVVGIDPALADEGEKTPEAKSKFAAVILGYSHELQRQFLLHFENERWGWSEQVTATLELQTAWSPELFAVEEVAYQRVLRQEMQQHTPRPRVKGVKPDLDKFRRIVGLTRDVQMGRLWVGPRWAPHARCGGKGCEGCREGQTDGPHQVFVKQAVRFPRGTHVDLLDAYYMAKTALGIHKMFSEFVPAPPPVPAADHPHVQPTRIATPKPGEWTAAQLLSGGTQ